MAAFVLGNGISRQSIDPADLAKVGAVYGCNALYRTFTPTVLVATDTPIAREIQESGYSARHRFYTRRPIANLGGKTLDKKYFGFSSGPNALAIAAQDGNDPIYLLGFDMGPAPDGKFNNLYAGTQHYKSLGSTPTFTGNWIRQVQTVMQDFPQQRFVRVMGETTAHISELELVKNFSSLPMNDFLARINTGKDL